MINTQHFVIPACALQGTQAGIQEEIVGTVPRTVRKPARSGTAPYALSARRSLLSPYRLF